MEKLPSSFYLIRDDQWERVQTSGTLSPLVIPYKVERGRQSFQYGTKRIQAKTRQGNQAKKSQSQRQKFLSTYKENYKNKINYNEVSICEACKAYMSIYYKVNKKSKVLVL